MLHPCENKRVFFLPWSGQLFSIFWILYEVDSRPIERHEDKFSAFFRRPRNPMVVPVRDKEFVPPSADENGNVKFNSQKPLKSKSM